MTTSPEPQKSESGLPMPDPLTFPDGGPEPLIVPEHRPDSEWPDGKQPPAPDETQLMLRPDFSDD